MKPEFEVRFARTSEEVRAAQRLRYDVFVNELGGGGPLVDHRNCLEKDAFDPFFEHLLLFDHARPRDPVVGVYRVMQAAGAKAAGRWYTQDEYDLAPLIKTQRTLLELGRSCLHPDYRGGAGMLLLWQGLAEYIEANEIEILFGVASFHGTNLSDLAQPLSFLHQKHLAPQPLRVLAKGPTAVDMNILPSDEIDNLAASRQIPALIKAYLRLGAFVGQGAWVDHDFNTTDVCIVIDTTAVKTRQKSIYTARGART